MYIFSNYPLPPFTTIIIMMLGGAWDGPLGGHGESLKRKKIQRNKLCDNSRNRIGSILDNQNQYKGDEIGNITPCVC